MTELLSGLRDRVTERAYQYFATPSRLALVAAGALDYRIRRVPGPNGYGVIAGEVWKSLLSEYPRILPELNARTGLIQSPTGQKFEVGISGEDYGGTPVINYGGYYTRIGSVLPDLSIVSQYLERPVIGVNPPGYGRSDSLTTDQLKAFKRNPEEGFRFVTQAQIQALAKHGVTSALIVGESMGSMFAISAGIEAGEFDGFDAEAVVTVSPRTTDTTLRRVIKGLLKSQSENHYNTDEPAYNRIRRIRSSINGIWNTLSIPLHDRYLLLGAQMTSGIFPDLVETFCNQNPDVPLLILYGLLDELNDPDINEELFSPDGRIGSLVDSCKIHLFPYQGEGHAMMVHPARLGHDVNRALDLAIAQPAGKYDTRTGTMQSV